MQKIDELKQKVEQYNFRMNCYSDNTYEAFENYIMCVLPLAIEEAKRNNWDYIILERPNTFSCRRKGIGDIDELDYNGEYHGEVFGFDFIAYFYNIPGMLKVTNERYYFDLKTIELFYYGELQRIEYQTRKSR